MQARPRPVVLVAPPGSDAPRAQKILQSLGVHIGAPFDSANLGLGNAAELTAFAAERSAAAQASGRHWWLLAHLDVPFHLDLMRRALPDALFVVCRRDRAESINAVVAENPHLSPGEVATTIGEQASAITRFATTSGAQTLTIEHVDYALEPNGFVYPVATTALLGQVLAAPRRRGAAPNEGLPTGAVQRPLFVIGCARAGTTLLYETLRESETFWSWWYESNAFWARHPGLQPAARTQASDRLDASDAIPGFDTYLRDMMLLAGQDRDGRAVLDRPGGGWGEPYRFLEKTPKNVLRVPVINALFPDARFVFIARDGRANISSLLEQWHRYDLHTSWADPAARWAVFTQLPGWLLWPGWQEDVHRPMEEVAARWYAASNATALQDLDALHAPDRVYRTTYEEFVAHPAQVVSEVCEFVDVPFDASLRHRTEGELPLSAAVSRPDPDKWRKLFPNEVERARPLIEPVMTQLGYAAL